ncbi:hypothetical protein GALL_302010 [mine drainage metagenome]|uniref:Uncharacterized protein n=1 Tax=mine drainage metagenome TaxID=410659 RepID=A0A1J5QX93_9ZZZZ
MRIVYGAIVQNRVLIDGSKDFQVTRDANGLVEVAVNPPFETLPVVVLTQHYPPGNTDFNNGGGDTRDNSVLVAVDKGRFLVKNGDNVGTPRPERAFHFIAMAPGQGGEGQGGPALAGLVKSVGL